MIKINIKILVLFKFYFKCYDSQVFANIKLMVPRWAWGLPVLKKPIQ